MPTKICPKCHQRVIPQPVGWTDKDGNYNYEFTECPLCEYQFKASELVKA